VPLDKVGSEVRDTNLPKNTEIVVYCGRPEVSASRMAAEKLVKLAMKMFAPMRADWKSGSWRLGSGEGITYSFASAFKSSVFNHGSAGQGARRRAL